ncbi:hypothetical protein H4582DRAFT_1983483 [Lactarius indigo]|nr:hypothetical protein H4582DRAFT_1983483 [Lactarius indigo]
MGSASSKAARTFPAVKPGKPPSWGGARTPAHDPKTSPPPTARQPWASESKDEVIQNDARDPHLLANLNKLGPVRVDHHMQTVQTQARFKELFRSRARSEDEAASMRIPRNHLLVSSLVALLGERQSVFGRMSGSDAALRQLAEKYGMDVERLESLARSVNVPRVREGGVRYIKDAQSGEETAISEVAWKESVAPLDS